MTGNSVVGESQPRPREKSDVSTSFFKQGVKTDEVSQARSYLALPYLTLQRALEDALY